MSNLYRPAEDRYRQMPYRRCGASGLKLPAVSLGLWHNFGSVDDCSNARQMTRTAFDLGITHFDLANNYGPAPGSAEENFGKILKQDFTGNLRDELVISTKAGYLMWDGPYGEFGSRKSVLASLDQSLKRLDLEYVDIFYSHRPDPETPLEETMLALDSAVRQGKALYVGISNYDAEQTAAAIAILKELRTPFIIHQVKYSMLVREAENALLKVLEESGAGCIAFSPLAQGRLTDRYFKSIPTDSRAARDHFLKKEKITGEMLLKLKNLNNIAQQRGQTLAQMALSWVLKDPRMTSVLIGASSSEQIAENVRAADNTVFSTDELAAIDKILTENNADAL